MKGKRTHVGMGVGVKQGWTFTFTKNRSTELFGGEKILLGKGYLMAKEFLGTNF